MVLLMEEVRRNLFCRHKWRKKIVEIVDTLGITDFNTKFRQIFEMEKIIPEQVHNID